uniref:Uncharacterized protein n=1 Tax=viral metagenome TaxID=1070528 RepID=A0A6C0LTR2_9ZZZZ
MSKENRTLIIIIGIIIIILGYWLLSSDENVYTQVENFTSSPYQSSKELDRYYEGATVGIEDYLVDNMTCHPSCCGDQWPVPFDGMTGAEVEKCITERGKPGPFVRTNYTCANGINGVGCPCIKRDPYLFLVNRGNNVHYMGVNEIEPSFLIRNDVVPSKYEEQTPYEQIQSQRSMFRNEPKINDLSLQREPQDLKHVREYGSPVSAEGRKLETIYE